MLRIISIKDVGMRVDIPGRGVMRAPVERILLDGEQVRRLYRMHNGPRNMYFVNPTDKTDLVRITDQNFMMEPEEIFKKATADVEIVGNDVHDDENASETDSFTLDDVKDPEAVTPEETSTVVVNPVTDDEPEKKEEDDFDKDATGDTDDEEDVVETTTTGQLSIEDDSQAVNPDDSETTVAETVVPVQRTYNNHNNYHGKNNNNGRKSYDYRNK